jgi:2-polyprenyl-6-methoxyphenol hydroxylase-like FAD-dependent oxidoreductase
MTGFGLVRILRADLMKILLAAAEEAAINVIYGADLEGIEETDSRVTALFKDGSQAHGDLLLGCDGIHSAVRRLHVDPACTPEYSGIANMFSLVETWKLPPLASSLGELHTTLTSDGILGLTPATRLRDTMYWFFSRQVPMPPGGDERDGWKETRQREIDSYRSNVLGLLGEGETEWTNMVRALVCKSDTIQFYPIHKLQPGRPWFKGRCLLLGDAAHAMPPHAGQGVSMALEDAFLLARVLKSDCQSVSDGLQMFMARRKVRTEKMLSTAQRNGTVRSKKGAWRLWTEEHIASLALRIYDTVGLEKWGLGQQELIYDVDDEVF